MFRVKNKSNPLNFYRSDSAAGLVRLKKLFKNANLGKGLVLAAVVVGAIAIWTHGTFSFKASQEDVELARLSSPMSLEWQQLYFGKQICRRPNFCGAEADPDKDGLSNYQEYLFFTDPTDPDSDGDGINDGQEVRDYKNPIGVGTVKTARDVTDPYDINALNDEVIKLGLDEIKAGDVMSVEQIQMAAARLTELPAFTEIPFTITSENNQAAVDEYARQYGRVTQEFLSNPAAAYASSIADNSDQALVEEFMNQTAFYATTLVAIPVPSDLFAFNRAAYGSLIYQSLIAKTQKEFLEDKFTDQEARERVRVYSIYYTRFVQDMAKEAEAVSQKYNFPINLDSEI